MNHKPNGGNHPTIAPPRQTLKASEDLRYVDRDVTLEDPTLEETTLEEVTLADILGPEECSDSYSDAALPIWHPLTYNAKVPKQLQRINNLRNYCNNNKTVPVEVYDLKWGVSGKYAKIRDKNIRPFRIRKELTINLDSKDNPKRDKLLDLLEEKLKDTQTILRLKIIKSAGGSPLKCLLRGKEYESKYYDFTKNKRRNAKRIRASAKRVGAAIVTALAVSISQIIVVALGG